MPRVLLVGENQSLLQTRAAVLEQTGAEVVWLTPAELAADREPGAVDVLVVCHSIRVEDRRSLIANSRKRWPGVQVLQLVRYDFESSAPELGADGVAISANPAKLLSRITEMLGG
jgi:DNA-binding response OmpR family regulator